MYLLRTVHNIKTIHSGFSVWRSIFIVLVGAVILGNLVVICHVQRKDDGRRAGQTAK